MMETIVIHLPGPKGFTRSADFSRVPTLGEMVLLDNKAYKVVQVVMFPLLHDHQPGSAVGMIEVLGTAYEGHMTNW